MSDYTGWQCDICGNVFKKNDNNRAKAVLEMSRYAKAFCVHTLPIDVCLKCFRALGERQGRYDPPSGVRDQ